MRLEILTGSSLSAQLTVDKLSLMLEDESALRVFSSEDDLEGGDFLFALSYPTKIQIATCKKYTESYILHGSKLPQGKGWSPIIWQILKGETSFVMSMISISDSIDGGDLASQMSFEIPKSALHAEIQERIAEVQAALILDRVSSRNNFQLKLKQEGKESFYPRRFPTDSRIDPDLSILAQWDLIRSSDPDRYPAYFEAYGRVFELTLRERPYGD